MSLTYWDFPNFQSSSLYSQSLPPLDSFFHLFFLPPLSYFSLQVFHRSEDSKEVIPKKCSGRITVYFLFFQPKFTNLDLTLLNLKLFTRDCRNFFLLLLYGVLLLYLWGASVPPFIWKEVSLRLKANKLSLHSTHLTLFICNRC